MSYLTEWIANIIVFILLAVVIDLLLPSSSMQKYAKMVISLLLIIVIINPIFKLLSTDLNVVLAEFHLQKPSEENEIKNLIEFQKKEIQASQRAYILEQMAVQMKTMAKEELVQSYGVTISRISLSESEKADDIISQKDLNHIQVVLQPGKPEEEASNEVVEAVKPISIDTANEPSEKEPKAKINQEEVAAYLANIWDVPKEKISLELEGGEELVDGR